MMYVSATISITEGLEHIIFSPVSLVPQLIATLNFKYTKNE